MCTQLYKTLFHLIFSLNKTLLVFCDEGVFRIVLDIFPNNLDGFKNLLPTLRGFHTAKAVLHAIGKYVNGSGLGDISKYTKVYGSNGIIETTNRLQKLGFSR